MKNLFLSLAFILAGTFCYANEKNDSKIVEDTVFITNIESTSQSLTLEDSCTIRTGIQIISNGEVTFQVTSVFHIDGISCEDLFSSIMDMF